MKGRLRSAPDYKCRKWTTEIILLVGLQVDSVVVSIESLVVVNKFHYLGGGVEESILIYFMYFTATNLCFLCSNVMFHA